MGNHDKKMGISPEMQSSTTQKIIAKFKTPQEIEDRNAFIAGAEAARKDSLDLWRPQDLKKLSLEDLLDRLERVDNQASLLRWRVFAAIRAHFISDRLYGEYLNELRSNPDYAGIIGSQQDAHRSACAGRFCEKYGINNLNDAGILKSAIYELSRPANADIADGIYKQIKRKSLPIEEVKRLIAQTKAIDGTVVQEPERIDYSNTTEEPAEPVEIVKHRLQVIPVINGHIPGVIEAQQEEALTNLMADAFAKVQTESIVAVLNHSEEAEDFEDNDLYEAPAPIIVERKGGVDLTQAEDDDLILELASRLVTISDEQKVAEILLLTQRYGLSAIKLIPVLQAAIRECQGASYFKKKVG